MRTPVTVHDVAKPAVSRRAPAKKAPTIATEEYVKV